MTIRPYRPHDADALYDVCLRTGAAGEDASRSFSDPHLLGSVYVGPYLALEPGLAFVLDDGDGAQGYVLGARDTTAFALAQERVWWPVLRSRYPEGTFAAGTADAGIVTLLHHPHVAEPTVVRTYPSHLHIDLLPRWQGAGWGRRLMTRALTALAETGSPGVHLEVSASNGRAIGFYRRMGFVEIEPRAAGVTMGRRLEPAGDPVSAET
ncbi:MAG TPA: N-acetyltransferase [Pengzhenrongella sp.]